MSARKAKNEASTLKFQTGNIADLVDMDINRNQEVNHATDRMKELKKKMQKGYESNKQVTVYLTPENFKRFNKLTAKGEKSELINQLLDMYFEQE